MSDERDERDRADDEATSGDSTPPEEEKGGLGLTEEFARIESEIESEVGPPAAAGAEAGPDEPELPPPREVRFDETDSSEWVAPVEGRAGDETHEWGPEPPEAPDEGDAAAAEVDPDDEPSDDAPEDPDPAPVEEPPASEHTIIRPRPLAPRPPAAVVLGGGGLIDDAVLNVKTPALWWRFMTGSVLIVVSVATSISMYLLFQATGVADELGDKRLVKRLKEIVPGDPQTIMIVGSDERSNTPGDPGRSDTTMLLRVDAEKQVLSLFSLPRDLKVEIPNYGTGRLNEAFTAGGATKTLRTVENLIGQEIDIVVNVDFQGFADAVNAIECVYIDVDRDYFNDNSQAFTEADKYAEIDINAGYQRLCGLDALNYVRYRKEDNDIIRAARQQDFLREARQKIPPSELLFNGTGNDLIDIFTEYTSTNVDEAAELIGILKSFIAVRDVPIQQVSFEGNIADVDENGVAYVTATDEQIDKAVDEFLNGTTTEGPRGGDDAGEAPDEESKEKDGRKKGGKKKGDGGEDPTDGADVVEADASFARFGATSARRLKFPVWVPTVVVPGSTYSPGSRQYEIKDLEEDKQPAYKLVIAYQTPSTVTEYYGVQGTTWSDPPILKKPSESREIDGRTYDLFYDGDRLRLVAWEDAEGNSYWVSNTLAHTLGEAEMLAIATSMDEAHG